MKKNKFKLFIVCSLALTLWGCDSVEPWEKGALAQYSMLGDRDPLDGTMADHVYYTREAAMGGSGVGGGGCGCN
jgi:hypothetical protein